MTYGAVTLRGLVGLVGPGGLHQPIAATYPISEAKAAVAHAVRRGKVLLDLRPDPVAPGIHP